MTKQVILVITLVVSCLVTFLAGDEQSTWDGSRSRPVHRLSLMDENNEKIIPGEPYPLPYSTRTTCGPCHNYDKIAKGLHFNAGMIGAEPGRPGEPWFLVDEKNGTVLPVSNRSWPGSWKPGNIGLSPWDMTLLFGRHMPGGGLAEPGDRQVSPQSRWNVSGALEINCLACHHASREQDHSEWAKQVMRQNFRWAGTAAAGLGEVGGMASRLAPTWDPIDGPNPDDTVYAVVPSVTYNVQRFDSKNRVFFDVLRMPGDNLCLTCHSVYSNGMQRHEVDGDVHSTAGLTCVDCHRNDLSHKMNRGYETGSALTCTSCHMPGSATPGRLGAPAAVHRGLPVLHLERLACTVCHTGSLPAAVPTRVKTSRANRLGIYGIAHWQTEAPYIMEPVYQKDPYAGGKITPHRLVWAAYWGRAEGSKITPLLRSTIDAVLADKGILETGETIARILASLANVSGIKGTPVAILSGYIYRANMDGRLDRTNNGNTETNKSFDQTFSKVWPPAGSPKAKNKSEVGEIYWGLETKDQQIIPLIPGFDTTADPLDMDTETLITGVLENLTATLTNDGSTTGSQPVLLYKDKQYYLESGYLESKQNEGQNLEEPRLCLMKNQQVEPLVDAFVTRTVVATTGTGYTLTEEQVVKILGELSAAGKGQDIPGLNGPGEFVYICGGKLFRLDNQGELIALEHEAAAPVLWPMAHDVRPAHSALGSGGCTDCHSAGSDFFFGQIPGQGPLFTNKQAKPRRYSFMGKNQYYEKLFGLSFTLRPLFKVILFISLFLVAAVLILIFFRLLGKKTGIMR